MRFLVVGGSGFIGSRIVAEAITRGHEVLATHPGELGGFVPFDLGSDRIVDAVGRGFFSGDRAGSEVTGALGAAAGAPEEVHVVICAAMSRIDQCFREPELSHRINVEATTRLIDDVAALGARVVFFSTSAIFDGAAGYYTETDPSSPICEYGRQKAEVEAHITATGARALVLRPEKVVGDSPAFDHPLAEWWRMLSEGATIKCIEGQVLAPTYVGDVARAVVRGCETGLEGLYHVANPEFFTREELVRQFARAMGAPVDLVVKPLDAFAFADGRPLKTYLDSTKLQTALGMRFTSMREAFALFAENVERVG